MIASVSTTFQNDPSMNVYICIDTEHCSSRGIKYQHVHHNRHNKVTHPPGHGVAILTVVGRDLNTALATDDDEEIIGQFSLLAQHIIFHVSFIHRLSQNGGDCLFLNIEQSTHNKQQKK